MLLVLLHACGLLCKPMGVTTPLVLLLLGLLAAAANHRPYPGNGRPQDRAALAGAGRESAAPGRVAAFLRGHDAGPARRLGFATPIRLSWRAMNVVTSYVGYLRLFFWPRNLAVFYEHPGSRQYWWQTAAALALLAAITLLAVRWRRKCPALIVGWLWYLGMFVPVIGLVQVGAAAMADRYTYLPQIGLGIALGLAAAVSASPRGRRTRRDVAAGADVAGLAANFLLINSEALWRHALACTPQNWLASNNMASVLLGKRQYDEAIRFSDEAIAFDSQCVLAYFNKAMALAATGRREEAIRSLQSGLAIDPRCSAGKGCWPRSWFRKAGSTRRLRFTQRPSNSAPGEDQLMNEIGAQLRTAKPPSRTIAGPWNGRRGMSSC